MTAAVLGVCNDNFVASVSTVFIVDDDSGVRASLASLARSVGFNAETFASAAQFLESFDPGRPGCLVVDVRMPGISGLELQNRLRAHAVRLPIIFMSGFGEVALATQALRAGAIDFLQKPFSPQVMLERLHEAVECDKKNRQERRDYDEVEKVCASQRPRARSALPVGQWSQHEGDCNASGNQSQDG
jgi:two-component system, LuxR family, response regulator FixJ